MAHCKDKSDEKQSYCGEFFEGILVDDSFTRSTFIFYHFQIVADGSNQSNITINN